MPYLTVHIASANTIEANGTASLPGHVWYSIEQDNHSGQLSYGFAPAPGYSGIEKLWCPGEVYTTDTATYLTDVNC